MRDQHSPRFRSPISVSVSDLLFRPFSRVTEIEGFSCGARDLDDFLKTEEVQEYAEQGYGKTTIVWQNGDLVGYYTVGYGELSAEELKRGRRRHKMSALPGRFIEENMPAVKIGRVAVDRRHQKKGIGRVIVAKIMDDTMNTPSSPLLVVTRANPGSIGFWERCGFIPVADKAGKSTSGSLTLFFDLRRLNEPDIRADIPL